MTFNELMKIKKPELTVKEIFERLSDDEKEEMRKLAIRETMMSDDEIVKLFESFSDIQKKKLIHLIIIYMETRYSAE